MTRIDRVLKKLSELYEFNRKLKTYQLKKEVNKSLKEDAAKKVLCDLCALGRSGREKIVCITMRPLIKAVA